jgi:hypothetical protein
MVPVGKMLMAFDIARVNGKAFRIQGLVAFIMFPQRTKLNRTPRRAVQRVEYQNQRFFDHLLDSSAPTTGLAYQTWQNEAKRDMEVVVIKATDFTVLAITNAVGDLCGFGIFLSLCSVLKRQRLILQSFVAESLYSLSDTTKSFLLILVTDGIVGFHSSIGWQCLGEVLLERFGFAPQNDLMLLFVSTCPVLLNTMFKYWVFRYLNKISPSTVVIYHNMIE